MAEPKIGGAVGDLRSAIDVDALNKFIYEHVPNIAAPVAVKQFQYGQSNPTYFLTDAGGKRFVMRKKPAGDLLSKTAHAVEREFKMLVAIQRHNEKADTLESSRIPIPCPYALCEDVSVLGTPFYIMEFLDGRIFADFKMLELPPDERRACWISAVQTLGRLASLDPDSMGLSSFGPRTAFYPRQLKSLAKVSEAQAAVVDKQANVPVGNIPFYHESMKWYSNNLPDESYFGSRIVHGDFKIDNLVFHPKEARVIGILDWELCTLGNPLSDLGNLTLPYNFGPVISSTGYLSLGLVGAPKDQIPISLEEVEKEYAKATRVPYPIPGMKFVRSWMTFRLAIISQGIAARNALGQASSENAGSQGQMFHDLGKIARSIYLGKPAKSNL